MRTPLRTLAALALLGAALAVVADVPVPALTARVTDLTGTLNADQTRALEQTLAGLEARKGSQIAVLLVPTTQPETIEQYGIRIADAWKIGRKRVDDGAILIVAKNDRSVRIEVGYGLEGALNDATCERIISEAIVPRFQQGDFYGGIAAGVDRMIRVVSGEPLPAPSAGAPQLGNDLRQIAPVVLLLAFIIGGVLRLALGRVAGALVTGGALGFLAWFMVGTLFVALGAGVIAFFVTLLAGGMGGPLVGGFGRGGFGGGFGSGSFGGTFGGGFGGGGGTFGGGGASGRW